MSTYWLEAAWLDGAVHEGVRVAHRDGVITSVTPGTSAAPTDTAVEGFTVPGFANAHSHAFHRALRGRTNALVGDFWSWRESMYRVAARLDLENYERLATAVFAEMVLAGYTAVGEFHYVHHQQSGQPHDDANAMGLALARAAERAGIRLTLLDVIYQRGGLAADGSALELSPRQRRFGDGGLAQWFERHRRLRDGPTLRIGAAVHSVRAVDIRQARALAGVLGGAPFHVHVSEQVAENAQSVAAYGVTPVAVLWQEGMLGSTFTAVHATHLTDDDVALLARSGSHVCFCPTTERDLGDGIGRARDLADAGVRLAIGSDQHVVLDPFDELRALEGHERLRSGARGRFTPAELLDIGTAHGYSSLGWAGGRLAVGQACDFVTIARRSPRTAGARLDELWLAASSADVRTTVVNGRRVVADGVHTLGDVGALLAEAISEVTE